MLIEVRYYSPTNYRIIHFGLVEANTYEQAIGKVMAANIPLRLGTEPLSFKKVNDPHNHDWGYGFNSKIDLDRRLV